MDREKEILKNIVMGAMYLSGLEDRSNYVEGEDFIVWNIGRRIELDEADELASAINERAKFFEFRGARVIIESDEDRSFIIVYKLGNVGGLDEDSNSNGERALS